MSLPGWKANELLVMEQMVHEATEVEKLLSKTEGDVNETIEFLVRRVGTDAAEKSEKSPVRKWRSENKRTALKRKEKRQLKALQTVYQLIWEEKGKILSRWWKREILNFQLVQNLLRRVIYCHLSQGSTSLDLSFS